MGDLEFEQNAVVKAVERCQTALKSFQGRARKSFQMISKVMGWECSFCVA